MSRLPQAWSIMNIAALPAHIVRTANSAAPTPGAEGRSAAESAALAAGYEHYQNSSTPVTLTDVALELGDSKVVYEKWNTKTSASLTADESIKTIEARLKKFQSSLAAARSDLAASNWDVTIKEGKLHVVGDVQAADKAAMENILNNDTKLTQAVASYMGAAAAHLETTSVNSAFASKNALTGIRQFITLRMFQASSKEIFPSKSLLQPPGRCAKTLTAALQPTKGNTVESAPWKFSHRT